MPFQPEINLELIIEGTSYRIAEHPAAPGMPYGQEGRAAVVYQVVTEDGATQALKVFKPRYRLPSLVALADRIAPFANLPGLQVCRRTVLTPQREAELLRRHPDLTYAVLMPWVEGPTWMEVMLEKRPLTPEESLNLARGLAEVLATMEQHGLAHCDLSGPNLMLPGLAGGEGVALVDVEQLYGSGLARPELLPSGSMGYAHKTAQQGVWGPTADRFAGAVLLGEILGWCDEGVREAAGEGSPGAATAGRKKTAKRVRDRAIIRRGAGGLSAGGVGEGEGITGGSRAPGAGLCARWVEGEGFAGGSGETPGPSPPPRARVGLGAGYDSRTVSGRRRAVVGDGPAWAGPFGRFPGHPDADQDLDGVVSTRDAIFQILSLDIRCQ